jgi:hypothetical protein
MIRLTAVLLVLYAGLLLTRAMELREQTVSITLATVGIISLPLAFGLWWGAGWARLGTLVVLLLMIAWMAIFAVMMAGTSGGRGVLQAVLTTPSLALASLVLEVVILILLLVPNGRARVHPGAAA